MLDIQLAKFAESSTTGLSDIVYMVTFKNLAGKILAGLNKSAKIFHYTVLFCVPFKVIYIIKMFVNNEY